MQPQNGVDLSEKAITVCKTALLQGDFYSTPAEDLPFEENRFDVVTCLGSLEHFVDPGKALKEMVRVAKNDAIFLLLVPNADFLMRRLGLCFRVRTKSMSKRTSGPFVNGRGYLTSPD